MGKRFHRLVIPFLQVKKVEGVEVFTGHPIPEAFLVD